MLELTESAQKELAAFFEGKEKSTIRVYLAPGGCSGPHLALALDAATDEDMSEDQGGFTFCINKELLAQVEGVKIDLSYAGFTVEPTVPLPQTGGLSGDGLHAGRDAVQRAAQAPGLGIGLGQGLSGDSGGSGRSCTCDLTLIRGAL